jgi:hypothetical protein
MQSYSPMGNQAHSGLFSWAAKLLAMTQPVQMRIVDQQAPTGGGDDIGPKKIRRETLS